MKAILQDIKSGGISIEDIPSPIAGEGKVLVRNFFSLVSTGTEKAVLDFSKASYLKKALLRPDLARKVINRAKNEGLWDTYKIVSELIDQKIPLGYSCCGEVISVGEGIHDLKVGDRVACAGLFVATHSEVVSVPRLLATKIPANCSMEEAAFVTVGAIAIQGMRLANIELSDKVVVYGLGLLGMITTQLAIAAGAKVIGVDIDPKKVELAESFGAMGVICSPEGATHPTNESLVARILSVTENFGADKVLICAATKSNTPVELVPKFTRQKGLVVAVGDIGMNLPRRDYYDKEIDVRISRSYGPGRYDPSYEFSGIDYPYAYVRWTENRNMEAILDLIARKRIDLLKLITHRFPIENAKEAYSLIENGSNQKDQSPPLGVLIGYIAPSSSVEQETLDSLNPSATNLTETSAHGTQKENLFDSSSDRIKVGIIGAGNFGKAFLLPHIFNTKKTEFAAICTASGVSAASVGKKYKIKKLFDSPQKIINDPTIESLVIATRHNSHAQLVCKALDASKAVYVEKPLAMSLKELNEVRSLYKEKERLGLNPFLMVGFNRRFSPLAKLLKQGIQNRIEPVALIYRVNAGPLAADSWHADPQQGGGRIIGEACHFVDFFSFLIAKDPLWVTANKLPISGGGRSENTSITIGYEDGSQGTIHYFSNGSPEMAKERVEAFWDGKSAVLENFKKLKIYGTSLPGKKFYWNQTKGFSECAHSWVNALAKGESAPIPFDSLYLTTKTTLLISEALKTGQKISIT